MNSFQKKQNFAKFDKGGKKQRKQEHTKAKKHREREADSDNEDRISAKKRKKSSENENTFKQIPVPKFDNLIPFRKVFWDGVPGEGSPSEELKQLRKSIGVVAKGNLSLCPPPVARMDCRGLPSSFQMVFKTLSQHVNPTIVQRQCWPAALSGANILAIAPTGSGKTYAYGLPMIPHIEAQLETMRPNKLLDHATIEPIGLVLVPTRELATQVGASLKAFKRYAINNHTEYAITTGVVYGGVKKDDTIDELLSLVHSSGLGGIHILVATPGRLLDLITNHKRDINLSKVSYFVLDEADKMLDLGFTDQITAISNQIRPDRQTLLFSATFPGRLRDIGTKWMGSEGANDVIIRCNGLEFNNASANNDVAATDHPKEKSEPAAETSAPEAKQKPHLSVGGKHSTLTVNRDIEQIVHICASHKKPRLLLRFIDSIREQEKINKVRQPAQILIFCGKIKTIGFVLDILRKQNIACDKLCGQMTQEMREKVLLNFKSGKLNILIATDVAARGIHIKRLKYVINYDFPSNLENYCHRVGRTGRDGLNNRTALLPEAIAPETPVSYPDPTPVQETITTETEDLNEQANDSIEDIFADAKNETPTEKKVSPHADRAFTGHAYSFFTRNLAPLANDLIALLETCHQKVEPNLKQLATEYTSGQIVIDSCDADDAEEDH